MSIKRLMDDLEGTPDREIRSKTLRDEAELFRLIIEGASDFAIFTLDREHRILTWNAGAERLTGFGEAEIIGRKFDILFTPGDRDEGVPEREVATAASVGRAEDDCWLVRRDGGRIFASGLLLPLRDENAEVRAFLKIFRDQTERELLGRRLEAAGRELEASEERYRLIISEVKDYGISMLDPEGIILTWNEGAARLNQYRAGEIVGQHFSRLFIREDVRAGLPEQALRVAAAEGRHEGASRRARKDGSFYWAGEVSTAIRQPDGTLKGFVNITRDVTLEKLAGEELRRSRDDLEGRVAERTAELSRALASLEVEAAARERTEHARLELLRRLVTVQEEERARISRELHDQMGQHIAALSMELQTLRDSFAESAASVERLGRLQETTAQVGRELHRLAFELRPPVLDDLGLEVAVQNYLEGWSGRTGIAADFHGSGFEEGRAPSQVETTVYRILQEALTNVVKHAAATMVGVVLERRHDSIRLIVEDNGRGFDVDAVMDAPDARLRLGLIGMKERVAMVGGTLAIESRPGGPTTLYVRIPVPAGSEVDHDG